MMARKRKQALYQQEIQSVRKETDNPAIIQDVIDSGFGALPESIENGTGQSSAVEGYTVRNSVDGKTWNSIEGR
ncbi:hypothetical protein [Bacillus marinisedimentorum]|uniref:hypothetical protein n=1 Tax=Bacillus marinisedimentorum TaxID=1821260 RepID=UPI0007E1C017|nr:hypothetical protein [Bacillus marinisedimentorum]